MGFRLSYTFFICVGLYNVHFSKAIEPQTCSKFSYEEQTLEKMIRTEIKVEMMVNEIKTTQDNVLNTLRDIKQTVASFSDKFVDLRDNFKEEMAKKGEQIKQREELFRKLFEETTENITIDAKESIAQLQEVFRNQFDETRTNLTNAVDNQRKEIAKLQGKRERPSVAFYAFHVNDKKLDTNNEVIIFDKTFINEGTGYDTTTGIFTAPIGGVYQFLVHTCKYAGKKTTIGLMLESVLIAGNINLDTDSYNCNTVGALVRVKSGEKVWVKTTNYGSLHQLYGDSARFNTFSGILINI